MVETAIKEALMVKPWRFVKFNEKPQEVIDKALQTFKYDQSVL